MFNDSVIILFMDLLFTGETTATLQPLFGDAQEMDRLCDRSCSDDVTLLASGGGFSPSISERSAGYESGIASPFNENDLFGVGEGYFFLPTSPPITSLSLTSQQQPTSSSSSSLLTLSSTRQTAIVPAVSSTPTTTRSDTRSDKQWERNRKNAIAAKQNREKKKLYMSSLENEAATLKAEMTVLKQKNKDLESCNARLKKEVSYLKAVLANQSTLSSLLAKIPTTEGVHLTSSFNRGKRATRSGDDDLCASLSKKRAKFDEQMTAGVCLHVANDRVSLEFCAECSLRS